MLTGAGTEVQDLALTGAIAGGTVGAAQAALLGAGRWAAVTAAAWTLGWMPTVAIGVDVDQGFFVFGSSGAVLVTILTGLALRRTTVAAAAA